MDWSRLPGITVEQNGNAANQDYGVGTTDFVGGTGDGQNGVSAMDSAPLKTTLHAKKSWFFFDDFIVFLGSDIRDTASAPVETIVEQWPLSAPDAPLVADGQTLASGTYSGTLPTPTWVSADGLGYFFPNATDVDAEIKDQSGDWSSLGVSSGSVSARFLTLAISHGSAPSGASYAYAIALEGQDMASWTAAKPFEILKNDPSTAAVRAGQSTGVVFWEAGSLDLGSGTTLGTDTPATVYLTDDGNLITVSAADPAWGSGSMKLTLSGTFQDAVAGDSGVSVDAATGTLTIDRENGVTHSAELARQGKVPVTPDAGADAGTNDAGSDGGPATKKAPASDSGGGCGCRAAGGAQGGAALLALAGLVWIGARRRRRRDTPSAAE
jgi:MYXO-CTERM domain-containing protein